MSIVVCLHDAALVFRTALDLLLLQVPHAARPRLSMVAGVASLVPMAVGEPPKALGAGGWAANHALLVFVAEHCLGATEDRATVPERSHDRHRVEPKR